MLLSNRAKVVRQVNSEEASRKVCEILEPLSTAARAPGETLFAGYRMTE
jgi:hypothetical protein